MNKKKQESLILETGHGGSPSRNPGGNVPTFMYYDEKLKTLVFGLGTKEKPWDLSLNTKEGK